MRLRCLCVEPRLRLRISSSGNDRPAYRRRPARPCGASGVQGHYDNRSATTGQDLFALVWQRNNRVWRGVQTRVAARLARVGSSRGSIPRLAVCGGGLIVVITCPAGEIDRRRDYKRAVPLAAFGAIPTRRAPRAQPWPRAQPRTRRPKPWWGRSHPQLHRPHGLRQRSAGKSGSPPASGTVGRPWQTQT
jgi:hypothetical protein